MAKEDIPEGFISTGKGKNTVINPETGTPFPARGAYNPATNEYIPRRQLEKQRIAAETGGTGTFEEKAKQRAAAPFRLPTRLKTKRGEPRYRIKTLVETQGTLQALPKNAQVWVRVLGRNPNPSRTNSPKFIGRGRISKTKYAIRPDRLRWITITPGIFKAGDAPTLYQEMINRLTGYYDIRYFEIVVVR